MTDLEDGKRDTIIILAALCAIFVASYFAELFKVWGLFGDGNIWFQVLWLGTAGSVTALGPTLAWLSLSSAGEEVAARGAQDQSADEEHGDEVAERGGPAVTGGGASQ